LGAFRLSPEKRPLLWLKVAAAAVAMRPSLKFVLAGDGPLRRQVEDEIKRLSLQAHVFLLGEIPDMAVPMAAADAMMLLSAQEGIPNVLLEAQWYGLRCLVTDAGGAREAISDGVTGIVLTEDEPTVLASWLMRMLDDQLLESSARIEGPPFLHKRFGTERMLDETWELYGID
jgi:glycosyltransferase involved in cell wall biosynthesis